MLFIVVVAKLFGYYTEKNWQTVHARRVRAIAVAAVAAVIFWVVYALVLLVIIYQFNKTNPGDPAIWIAIPLAMATGLLVFARKFRKYNLHYQGKLPTARRRKIRRVSEFLTVLNSHEAAAQWRQPQQRCCNNPYPHVHR